MKSQIIKTLFLTLILSSCSSTKWNYQGELGPKNWGSLSEDFSACKLGKEQSPINIGKTIKGENGHIDFNYGMTSLNLQNTGNTIQVNYDEGSNIIIDNQTYDLKQFNFHSSSENTINGKSYPLEMQLIHINKKGKIAVIAIMFKEGQENKSLNKIWDYLPSKKGEFDKSKSHRINIASLIPMKTSYYKWSGSLTTPPCSENVSWHLLKAPINISKRQIHKITTIMGSNNRPIQDLNGRSVSINQ